MKSVLGLCALALAISLLLAVVLPWLAGPVDRER